MIRSAFRAWLVLGAAVVLSTPAVGAEGWGTIEGKVVFDGAPPGRETIKVTEPRCLAKGALYSEELIVNAKNKGVKNVVVFLLDAGGKFKDLPIHPKLKAAANAEEEIDQPCCQFVPHILTIREGQGLLIKNSAAFSHNVHLLGGKFGPEFNVLLPPGGSKRVPAADLKARPRSIPVKCDIHGWMNGYIWVFPHPYYAVTDEDGKFRIKDAPAGKWKIVVWQESKGWLNAGGAAGAPITVNDGGTTDLGTMEFKPSKD
jgi:hypothetical protein